VANDLFSRNVNTLGGVFAADQSNLSFGQIPAGLTQSAQFQYSQMVNKIFEVESPAIYYVGGRTSGSGQLTQILGPKRVMQAFYEQFGNMCNARRNTINMTLRAVDCDSSRVNGTEMSARLCVLNNVSLGVESQGMLFNASSSLLFSNLVYRDQLAAA
jgi:hypothetical protein